MKKRVNITISEEALKVADESGNRSEYIENLITGAQQTGPKVVPLDQLEALLEPIKQTLANLQLGSSEKQSKSTTWTTIQAYTKELALPSRTRNEILSEITQLEADRDGELEYCQDEAENKRIVLDYKKQIDALWAEYHLLKEKDV